MIYIICRSLNEVKYTPPNGSKVIINKSTDDSLADIGAWDEIFKDATAHEYKNVGIYQARRVFIIDKHVMNENDYECDANDIFMTKYDLYKDTLVSQFSACHAKYAYLLEKILPSQYKTKTDLHYIRPHNMFYTSYKNFKKMYEFMKHMEELCKTVEHDGSKFFSFLSERLLTCFCENEFNIKDVKCRLYDKNTGKIQNEENGLIYSWLTDDRRKR